jgi:AraC-like DNA-binding protein
MRLLLPFVDLLQGRIPEEGIAALKRVDPDTRIPIRVALKLLDDAVVATGDPDLGLKAARVATQGDYDLLEYAMVSSRTVRDANEVLRRYVQLVNGALDYSIEIQSDRAISRFISRVPLSRAAADFQLGALYSASRRWLPAPPRAYSEIWFSYPEPRDTQEYARSFPDSTVRFAAPFDAIVFDRRYLDFPMPHADPKLHALLRKQLDHAIAELPPAHDLRRRVRKLIMAELASGNPNADHIAERLQMSRRTLTRQLLQDRTSFKALLEEVRRELAERALITEDVGMAEIATRLGFAEPNAFYRAFKRWTGMTPSEFRERNWRGPRDLE